MMILGRRAQYLVEYSILIVTVAMALTALVVRLRRATQGQIKLVDDEFSEASESWKSSETFSLNNPDK